MSDGVEETCPVCGGSVRVVGKTTLHYERVSDNEEIDAALDEIEAPTHDGSGVDGVALSRPNRIRTFKGVLDDYTADGLRQIDRADRYRRRALALATALGRSLKLVQAYAWTGRNQDVVACPWCHEAPDTIETHAPDCEVAAVLADLTGQAALAERTKLLRRLAEASEILAELEWGVADWEDIHGGTIETFSTCPSCTHRQREDHAADCRLAAWLGETKGG